MANLPSVEVLEQGHTFPCSFVFKAIGSSENDFVVRVVAAVRTVLVCEADPPYTIRQTGGGRHVAVTLEPQVQTAAQVLAVYRGIQQVAGLVMLL